MGLLQRVRISGFKSIREMDLQLGAMNVLIGANGAGKSNLVSAFGLLREIIEEHLQTTVARAGSAEALLHYTSKTTSAIRLDLDFGKNGYVAQLAPTADDTLFFEKEVCWFHGAGYARPFEQSLGSGHRETALLEAVRKRSTSPADYVLKTLRSWRVYHFHDTSASAPVKKKGKIDDNALLRPDASNLAAFLLMLRDSGHADHYRRIVAAIRQVAPFFDDFQLRADPRNPDMVQLEWKERGSDAYFNAHALSDGTLRYICLATLLLQPSPPTLVLIDEPELGLHPYAITTLAAMLQSASTRTQILIATQSVTLMNQFAPGDTIVVDRDGGQSTFKRITPEEIESWQEEYALGDLWEKNVIGGRPQRP